MHTAAELVSLCKIFLRKAMKHYNADLTETLKLVCEGKDENFIRFMKMAATEMFLENE